MRKIILGVCFLMLAGCISIPSELIGTVSTATYASPPKPAKFIVIPQDAMSLTDQNIANLIIQKLVELGYEKAATSDSANVAVMFRYAVGSGATRVSSSPNYATGMQDIHSRTLYPGQFQVVIVDIEKSKKLNNLSLIWQGEISSNGGSSNMSIMAPTFVDILIENASKDVMNKSFFRIVY